MRGCSYCRGDVAGYKPRTTFAFGWMAGAGRRITSMPSTTRVLRIATYIAGTVLAIIGVRFFLIPEHATRVFGIPMSAANFELQRVVAARDLWLGLLAIALALLKEWRALALWFGLGFFVCLTDAAIVTSAGGKGGPVAFHLFGAVLCVLLGILALRATRRAPD